MNLTRRLDYLTRSNNNKNYEFIFFNRSINYKKFIKYLNSLIFIDKIKLI